MLEMETLEMDVCSKLMWLVATEGFITVHIQLSTPKWIT